MAYGTRSGSIRTYWPDDTATLMYIQASSGATLDELIEKARQKWGAETKLEDLRIGAEHIHTDCLGYDRYDSGDHTDFITIEKLGA